MSKKHSNFEIRISDPACWQGVFTFDGCPSVAILAQAIVFVAALACTEFSYGTMAAPSAMDARVQAVQAAVQNGNVVGLA